MRIHLWTMVRPPGHGSTRSEPKGAVASSANTERLRRYLSLLVLMALGFAACAAGPNPAVDTPGPDGDAAGSHGARHR